MTPKNNNNTNYINKRISFSNVWPNKYYAEFQEAMCFCFVYIRIILNFPGFLGSCFPIDFLVFISTSLLLLFSIFFFVGEAYFFQLTCHTCRLKKQELVSFAKSADDVIRAVEESVKRKLDSPMPAALEAESEKVSMPAIERAKIVVSIQDKGGLKQFRVYAVLFVCKF